MTAKQSSSCCPKELTFKVKNKPANPYRQKRWERQENREGILVFREKISLQFQCITCLTIVSFSVSMIAKP